MRQLVLGLDLASGRWDDNGTALVAFEPGRWLDVRPQVLQWPVSGRPSATELASCVDRFCLDQGVAAVSIDGPQGWRDPAAGAGWGREADRAARTPGKMGPPRSCVPGTYIGWVSLAVELFDRLLELPHARLVNIAFERLDPPEPGEYYVLECFPTSIWRTAGLEPLPGKAKTRSTAPYAQALANAFGLPHIAAIGHDDLQAVVAALPAAALLGGPARAVPRGVPATTVGSDRIEGIIWDAEPTMRTPPAATPVIEAKGFAEPVLVVVTGPPGAGKTTVAGVIAKRLGLPLLEKDPMKETLHDAVGGEGREWSQTLGVATFELLFHVLDRLLESGVSVVVEANFSHIDPLLGLRSARIVQVHVSASPEALRERLESRPDRHAVHYDAEIVGEVLARVEAGEWAPLELGGELIEIDTSVEPDPAEVAEWVATLVRATS